MTRLARGTDGAVFVETLIAVMVPVFFFFSTWQLADLMTAQLIVKHAAVAAARAAVVVGPDDPRFYGGQKKDDLSIGGTRRADVNSAASMVLSASPHFRGGGFKVELAGGTGAGASMTATVTADYPCFSAWLNMVCGGGSYRSLTGKAVLPYQFASYSYGPYPDGVPSTPP